MKKKQTLTDDEKLQLKEKDVIYCTECGEDLEIFGCEDGSFDLNSVKLNFEKCKKIGKFKGEICSKLFIASENFTDFEEE
jgi:hypothetical protein